MDPTVGAFSFLGMVLWIYKWFKPDGRLTDEQIADGMVDMLFPASSRAVGDAAGSGRALPAAVRAERVRPPARSEEP